MNWIVVKLRSQDFNGVKSLITQLSSESDLPEDICRSLNAVDEFTTKKMLRLDKQVSSRKNSMPNSSMGGTHLKSADYEISPSKQSSTTKNVNGTFGGTPTTFKDDI